MEPHFVLHSEHIFNTQQLSQTSFPDFCLLAQDILTQRTEINNAFTFSSPSQPSSTTSSSSNTSAQYTKSFCNKFPNFTTHFDKIETVGFGSFSTVYKVQSKYDGKVYCAKELPSWQDIPFPPCLSRNYISNNRQHNATDPIPAPLNQPTYSHLLSQQFPSSSTTQQTNEHDGSPTEHFRNDLSSYTEREYLQITTNLVILRELATNLYCTSKGLCDSTPLERNSATNPTNQQPTTIQSPTSYSPIIPLISICEKYSDDEQESQELQLLSKPSQSRPDRVLFLIFPLYSHTLQDILELSASPLQQPTTKDSQQQLIIPKPICYTILHTIARGLNTLHTHHIVHRDIKPSNILFDQTTGKFAICDFGSVRYFSSTQSTSSHIPHLTDQSSLQSMHPIMSSLSGPHGTLGYKPLDLILLNPASALPASMYPGHTIDVWALGCIAFALFGFQSRNGLLPRTTQPQECVKTILSATLHGSHIISTQTTGHQQPSENEEDMESVLQDPQDAIDLFKFIMSSLFNPPHQQLHKQQQQQQQQQRMQSENAFSWSEFTAAQYIFSFLTPYPISEPFLSQSTQQIEQSLSLHHLESPTQSHPQTLSPPRATNPFPPIQQFQPLSWAQMVEKLSKWNAFQLVFHSFLVLSQQHYEGEFNPPSQPLPLLQKIVQPMEYNLLIWTLALLPEQRPTTSSLLQHPIFATLSSSEAISAWFNDQLERFQQQCACAQENAIPFDSDLYYEDGEMPYSSNPYTYGGDDDEY